MTTESALLSARDAAAVLGVCRSFMTEHAAELGGRKVGSLLKFRRADLDAYLEQRRVKDATQVAQPVPTPIRRTGRSVVRISPLNGQPYRSSVR